MLNRLLVIVGIALVVMSCAKDSVTNPPVTVEFTNTEFMKATVKGVAYNSVTASSSGTVTGGQVFFTIAATGTAGILQLSASVPETGTGTFTLGDGITDKGVISFTTFESGSGVTYSTTNGATGSITIEKIDVTQKRVRGKFSGTVKQEDGSTIEIKDGTFEAKWT